MNDLQARLGADVLTLLERTGPTSPGNHSQIRGVSTCWLNGAMCVIEITVTKAMPPYPIGAVSRAAEAFALAEMASTDPEDPLEGRLSRLEIDE